MNPIRLAHLAVSPMYYQTPLYRHLAADPRLDFTALFASSEGIRPHSAGFGQPIVWDSDLISDYQSTFLARSEQARFGRSSFGIIDPDIVTALRKLNAEVLWLHGYNYVTHQLAALYFRLLRRPILVREEQTLLDQRSLGRRIAKRVALPWVLSSARGLYIGHHNKLWFQQYGVEAQRLFHVPYCVDNHFFSSQASVLSSKREELRANFGIPTDSGPLILFVGRLIPKKQPLLLLEAFNRLQACTNCSLLVIGTGEQLPEMQRRAIENGNKNVYFAGFLNQSEISRAYAASDIFVLPSGWDETWGLVVNEAMNFSLPIVVSDKVGCGSDLVLPAKNGFVFPHEDVDALTSTLKTLVSSSELRQTMGRESRTHVAKWTYKVAASGIVAAVSDAVGPERWSRVTE